MAGLCLYCNDILYFIALLNSVVVGKCLEIMNPTINYPPGTIANIPIRYSDDSKDLIDAKAKENIELSKADWNLFETSWDFQHHPLLCKVSTIAEAFDQWQTECDDRFNQLKANE